MGFVDSMRHGECLVPEWKIWRFAGYGFLYCCNILCTHHCWNLHLTKKISGCRQAIQGFWLPGVARYLHIDGNQFLHLADYLQTTIYMAWSHYYIDRNSFVFYCSATEKKQLAHTFFGGTFAAHSVGKTISAMAEFEPVN